MNTNRVVLTGNLTRDPELRSTPSGTSVCTLRVACNTRRKDASGEWVDKPNYFDVVVWGRRAEVSVEYLSKGRPVAIDGRLEWREWETREGDKRQAVEIVADSVEFLRSGQEDGDRRARATAPTSDVPADTRDLPSPGGDVPTAAQLPGPTDDIPF